MNRRKDIEKTWKSLAELKEELYHTEKKITDSQKFSFLWNKTAAAELKSDKSSVRNNSKRSVKRKIFTRPVDTDRKDDDTSVREKKSELNLNGASGDHQLHVVEDQPKHPPLRTPSENSKDVRQRLISSAVNNVTLSISSDDTDASFNRVPRKQFLFGTNQPLLSRYSVRDTATQTRFVSETLPFTQTLNTNGEFSEWDKNFLQKEIFDLGSIENGIINSPRFGVVNDDSLYSKLGVQPSEPRPKLQPTISIPGGLEKVKGIIERQREQHEKALSEVDFGDFLDLKRDVGNTEVKTVANGDHRGVNFPAYSQTSPVPKPEPSSAPEKIDAEVQVKPPVVRKTTLVPYPPEYRGFSTYPRKETKPAQNEDNVKSNKNHKEARTPRKADAGQKSSSSKRQRKTSETKTNAKKKEISPFSWRTGQKLVFKELGPMPNILPKEEENKYSQQSSTVQHDSSDSLSGIHSLEELGGGTMKFPSGNAPVIDDEADPKNEIEMKPSNSKNDDKENDVPLSPQFSSKDQDKVIYLDISSPPTKGSPKKSPVSKKRKATKQPGQKGPSPKIRHYDQEKVREYIQKQKSERRKKVQEEKQKLSDTQKAKKERLQRLYDYQRSTAKTVVKTKVPQVPKVQRDNTKVVRRTEESAVPKDMVENLHLLQKAPSSPLKVSVSRQEKTKSVSRVPSNAEGSVRIVPSHPEKPTAESKEVTVNLVDQEVHIPKNPVLPAESQFSLPVPVSDSSDMPAREDANLPCSHTTNHITSVDSTFINCDKGHGDCRLQSNLFAPVNSEKAEELKNMALSIQHLFEKQMESMLRTKSVVQSRTVLPEPSNSFMAGDGLYLDGEPLDVSVSPNQMNNSVVTGQTHDRTVGKSGDNRTFRERLPDVGSMQELYSRLLENDGNSSLEKSGDAELQTDEKPHVIYDSNVESEGSLSEGPLDSEEDLPDELHGHIEVSQKSPIDRMPLSSGFKPYPISSAFKSSEKYSSATYAEKQKPVPDPFNFINTYIRKPLTIPSSFYVTETSQKRKNTIDVDISGHPLSGRVDANHVSLNRSVSYTPDFTESRDENSQLQSHKTSKSTIKDVNSDFTSSDVLNSPFKGSEPDVYSEKSASSLSLRASRLSKHSAQSDVESRKSPSLNLTSKAEPTHLEDTKISERNEINISPAIKETNANITEVGESSHSPSSSEGLEPLSRDVSLSSMTSEIGSVPDNADGDPDQSIEEHISRPGSSVGTVSIKSDVEIADVEKNDSKISTENNNNIQSQISSIKEISSVDVLNAEIASTKSSVKSVDIQSQISSIKEVISVHGMNAQNVNTGSDDIQSHISSIKEVSGVDVIPNESADTNNSHSDNRVHTLKSDKTVKSSDEIVSSALSEGPLSDENSIAEENSVVSSAHSAVSENVPDEQESKTDDISRESESLMDVDDQNNVKKEEPNSISFSPKSMDYTSSSTVPKILTSTQIMPNGKNRSPSVLDLHLRSNLTHLENLQDSLVHLAELNRIHSGASKDGAQDGIAVSQVLQVSHPVGMSSDQVFSTHVVTRVATEAATAAATSAVIAVLETRKSLLHKKHYLSSTDREASPSSKNESYRYSSDFETSPKSGDVSPAASEQSKTLTEGNGSSTGHSDQERSGSEAENGHTENSRSGGAVSTQSSVSERISQKSFHGSQVSAKSSETEQISTKSSKASNASLGSNVSQKISTRTSVEEQIPTKSSAVEHVLSKSSIIEQISPIGSLAENVSVRSSGGKQISSDSNIAEVVSNLINVKEPASEKKRKRSGNVSSPSPASLSDDDLLSSATISSSNSSVTQSSHQSLEFHSVLSEDSFAQLTLDMVRRMSREEELRAKHQLSVLQFQEKSLVEKARAEMTWLEILKRKLRQKGAEEEISKVNKRQQELALRLRQERAQLRCMQETYRSVSKRSQALITEKKKLLTDSKILGFEFTGKKERAYGSPHNSHDKNSEIISVVKSQSHASSTTTSASIATEENNEIVDEASSPEIPENVPSTSNISSAESLVEAQVTSQSKASHLSSSKTSKSSQQITTRHLKSELGSSSRLSHQPSRSHESVIHSLKKLEASKRYLTRKEQRLLQRRKEAESILQWQKKLDNEEMAIKELERKVLDTIDGSRRKKYIMSSSNSNVHQENSSNGDSIPQSVKVSGLKDDISTDVPSHTLASSQIKTSSVPTDTLHQTVASGNSIEEQFSPEKQSESVSEEIIVSDRKSSESSVKEEYSNIHIESSSENIPEDISHDHSESNIIEEANSFKSSNGSPTPKENLSVLSANTYSESFDSGSDAQNSSVTVMQPKSSSSVNGASSRKTHGITIRSPLIPRSHRRHDSSGSDDSYTISHSETASDQSDIEGRIHALTEELKSRRTELEKLKRERKKRYREQLKEKEKSLQKQLEAYDQYIQQTRLELEQQLEAASVSPPLSLEYTPSAVKPQIKKPCVAESRRLCKQASISPETSPSEKKGNECLARNSTNNRETGHDESDDTKIQSSLPKKFSVSGSKVPYKDISSEEDNHSAPSISAENSSIPSSTISDKNIDKSQRLEKSASFSSDDADVPNSHESARKLTLEDEKKFEENSSDEIPEEVLHSVSDKSISSNKTLQNESSEGDSLTDSHATISEGLLPEDELNVAPSSKIPDNVSPPPFCESSSEKPVVPNLNETFTVEKQDDMFVGEEGKTVECDAPVAEISVSKDKLDNEVSSTINATESQDVSSLHSQKTSASVIVEQVVFNLCNDAILCMMKIVRQKQDTENKIPDVGKMDNQSNSVEKSHSLRDIHEKAAIQVSEMLTESLLNDAIKVILNTLKKGHYEDALKPSQATSQKISDILASLEGKKTASGKSRPQDLMVLSPSLDDDFGWVDENLPSSELLKSTHSDEASGLKSATNEKDELDFVADQEWFEDDFVAANNQSQVQQLEQQLLQQYPYYYRQIPNKPPPPYTPPSSSSAATSVVPFSALRPKKPAEPVAIIPSTPEAISKIIDDAVDTLREGIQSGMAIADIHPRCQDQESPEEDIVLQCQKSYKNFLFDLAKECAVDMYGETEESPKPWIRSRRLTRKPQLPQDTDELSKSVQKEVFSVLKLPTTQTQEVPLQKGSLWSAMKLGRKKRDFVDNILISELKDEEPDWINYDRDELTVKFQLSDAICDVLLDDTIKSIVHMHAINEVPEFMCPHR